MDGSRRSNFKKKMMLCLASLVLLASWASAAETDADAASATFAPPSSAATSDGQTSDSSVKRAVEMTTAAYDSTTRSDADWSAELFESAEATSASTRPSPTPETTAPLPSTGAGAPVKSPSSWPWLVFVLSGNATVAGRRQRDLGTYLRLNLAARLDADYNDVAINRILLSAHSVLANISVEPSHLAAGKGLEALGRGNVTLLELSGAEFQVERIIRSDEALDQREMMNLEMASVVAAVGSEVTVYGAVGAVFLFLLVALLLGLSFNSPCRNNSSAKYLPDSCYDREQSGGRELAELRAVSAAPAPEPPCPPPVIYSEQLAREMCDSASLLPRSHFIDGCEAHFKQDRRSPC